MNSVKIRLYGELGKQFNKEYNYYANSVAECVHAININSGRKLYPWLLERDKAGIKYKLLINNQPFKTNQDLTNIDNVLVSELSINKKNLYSIDIVPVVEGADDNILGIFTVILGVILIATGLGAFGGVPLALKGALIVGGLGLLAGGVINLLMRPPQFEDFREIQQGGGIASYLFNGPQNVAREGGPVPVGYGRLIIGSQVVSASFTTSNIDASAENLEFSDTTSGSSDFTPEDINDLFIVPQNPLYDIEFTLNGRPVISLLRGGSSEYNPIVFPNSITEDYFAESDNLNGYPRIPTSTAPGFNTRNRHYVFGSIFCSDRRGSPGTYVMGGRFRYSDLGITSPNVPYSNLKIMGGTDGSQSGLCTVTKSSSSDLAEVLDVHLDSTGDTYAVGEFDSIAIGSATASARTRFAKIQTSTSTYSLISLSTNPSTNDKIRTITTDSSGNIYIGGDFTTVNSIAHERFAKLDSTGALIGGFTYVDVDNGSVRDIELDSDNKIYLAGSFTSISSDTDYKYIARLNTNGTLDSTFVSPTLNGSDVKINSIYIQVLDNKILIGGKWDTITSGAVTHSSKNLARLNTDGSIDTTLISRFDPTEVSEVFKVICRDSTNLTDKVDGKIFIGGNWTLYAGKYFPRYVRLFNGNYINSNSE